MGVPHAQAAHKDDSHGYVSQQFMGMSRARVVMGRGGEAGREMERVEVR